MPGFYDELAEWWPLFSHPSDYADEAATYAGTSEVESGTLELFVGVRE
jgi:hypothetical protein